MRDSFPAAQCEHQAGDNLVYLFNSVVKGRLLQKKDVKMGLQAVFLPVLHAAFAAVRLEPKYSHE